MIIGSKKLGYVGMSGRGRLLAELIELIARHDHLLPRKHLIPGWKMPPALVEEIAIRFDQLSQVEQAAIESFRCPRYDDGEVVHSEWDAWLKEYLKENPQDAPQLFTLQKTFAREPRHALPTYVETDWKLEHVQ